MLNNWKKKQEEKAERMNGYYDLSESLREKFDNFSSNPSSNKLSDYYTWEEFSEIFAKTTYLHDFSYNGNEYIMGSAKKRSKQVWWFEAHTAEPNNESCDSPYELLNKVRIEGKSLQEIWDELTLC